MPDLDLMLGSGAYLDDMFAGMTGLAGNVALYVTPMVAVFIAIAFGLGRYIAGRMTQMTGFSTCWPVAGLEQRWAITANVRPEPVR